MHERATRLRKADRNDEPGRAVAAIFASRAEGREAMKALRRAKLGPLWFATTSVADSGDGTPAVTAESSGFFRKSLNLVDALVHHGVAGTDARMLCDSIEPGNSVVTVESTAASLVETRAIVVKFGGRLSEPPQSAGFDARARAMAIVETTAMDFEALAELDEEIFYRR